jgi:hypothetical protein
MANPTNKLNLQGYGRDQDLGISSYSGKSAAGYTTFRQQ